MVYVLDGYNVIHAVPGLERKLGSSLRAARDALVALCLEIRRSRGDVEKAGWPGSIGTVGRHLAEVRRVGFEVVLVQQDGPAAAGQVGGQPAYPGGRRLSIRQQVWAGRSGHGGRHQGVAIKVLMVFDVGHNAKV